MLAGQVGIEPTVSCFEDTRFSVKLLTYFFKSEPALFAQDSPLTQLEYNQKNDGVTRTRTQSFATQKRNFAFKLSPQTQQLSIQNNQSGRI